MSNPAFIIITAFIIVAIVWCIISRHHHPQNTDVATHTPDTATPPATAATPTSPIPPPAPVVIPPPPPAADSTPLEQARHTLRAILTDVYAGHPAGDFSTPCFFLRSQASNSELEQTLLTLIHTLNSFPVITNAPLDCLNKIAATAHADPRAFLDLKLTTLDFSRLDSNSSPLIAFSLDGPETTADKLSSVTDIYRRVHLLHGNVEPLLNLLAAARRQLKA